MHAFEHQSTEQTLTEALEEYYRENPGLSKLRDMSAPAQEFFRCHDAAHVVFGCGTSLPHEAVVKLATVFGTTGGLRALSGSRLHESFSIYRKLKLGEVLATILLSIVVVPRTIVRCMRQRRKWPWSKFSQYTHVPLRTVRADLGIRVPGNEGAPER